MPVKKDANGKRWVEMEFVTPGTAEQVWQAMATGPGNAAWFTPATVDEHVGGTIRFDLGPNGSSSGEVTTWDPPRRFGYVERDWSEGAPPVATEITITSRSGDRCLVRMVHSLFSSSDDWDDQLESFEAGWPPFFQVLRLYLSHFPGLPASSFQALVRVEGDQQEVWKRLTETLDLAGADVGDRRTTPRLPEKLSGAVEQVSQDRRQRMIMLRVDEPAPGVALIGTYGQAKVNASLSIYFYGEGAGTMAAASAPRWQEWLDATFAKVT